MNTKERLKRLEEAVFGIKSKEIKKGNYIRINDILFRCYEEKNALCVAINNLSEDIVKESAKDKLNPKCIKENRIMFNSNIIDGEYGTSIVRRLLQGFEIKYLDVSKLNKVFGNDYVRLLKKEEVEELGSELHKSVDSWYWTMTFRNYDSDNWAYVFRVCGSSYPGHLDHSWVDNAYAVRPVISLKSKVLESGDGSLKNPFMLSKDKVIKSV